jgi:hypothetical protein
MCIIIVTQWHTSTTWINAQLFFPNDKLHVYYYRDPVTHKYYVDQHPVVFFTMANCMCIIILTHSHTITTWINAQLFFHNDKLHMYRVLKVENNVTQFCY